MVLLVQKLGRSLKLHSRLENHYFINSEALLASVTNFRSKLSSFLHQIFLKTEPGFEFLSLKRFQKCFELVHANHMAFAKFVVELDYPMSKWGAKATEEYLNYTLNLLGILNSISSSLSHLNQAKIAVYHGLTRFKNPVSSHLKKFPYPSCKDFKLERSKIAGIEGLSSASEKESLILGALMILKKTGFLSLGLVQYGLCSDAKPYEDIRKFIGGCDDDAIVKGLDSIFCKEMMEAKGVVEEVNQVNDAVDQCVFGAESSDEAVKELKRRLEALENSIQGIEKQANTLFSEVLATRNKLIDNLRIIGKNPHQQHKVW